MKDEKTFYITIVEALKKEDKNLRISNGNKWMVWDSLFKEWVVYKHEYGKKKSVCLISTSVEEIAVQKLLED